MRPPEHWHLRPRRQPRRWWWTLGALASLGIIVALVWVLLPAGGGEPKPPASAANGCPANADCPQGGGGPYFAGEVAPPKIAGQAGAVLEASCAVLLYGKNEHARLPPASLTKIATALVADEGADLDEVVDIDVNSALLAASTESTVMGREPGQRHSSRDLLYGLLLPSGNDAAIEIAEQVSGNLPAFVTRMNAKASALGLRDTHFTNPHGLDESGLYSSAYDMALLGRALLARPELATIVRTKRYQPDWPGPELANGNELLDLYPGTIGVKTGYTERAGQTMVAAAERGGRRLIVSVLSSRQRYADVVALFDWAFAHTQAAC